MGVGTLHQNKRLLFLSLHALTFSFSSHQSFMYSSILSPWSSSPYTPKQYLTFYLFLSLHVLILHSPLILVSHILKHSIPYTQTRYTPPIPIFACSNHLILFHLCLSLHALTPSFSSHLSFSYHQAFYSSLEVIPLTPKQDLYST